MPNRKIKSAPFNFCSLKKTSQLNSSFKLKLILFESYEFGNGVNVGVGIGSDGFLGVSDGSGVGSDGLVGVGETVGLGDSVGLGEPVGLTVGVGDGVMVGVTVGDNSNRTSVCGESATATMPDIKNKTAPIIKIVFFNIKTSLINFCDRNTFLRCNDFKQTN